MANDLVLKQAQVMSETEFEQLQRIAKMFSVSALFAAKGDDPKAIAETAVKIMAGREIGLGPFSSVQNIQVIHGNPTFSGHMIASAIKGSGKYDYRIVKWTDKECSIQFYEGGDKVGEPLSYTMEDARAAQLTGKDVWKKFPRAMLFNRAISAGYRAYCPDVLGGMRAYVPEEMGAAVDGDGNAIVVNGSVVYDQSTDEDTVDGVWEEARPIDPSGGEVEASKSTGENDNPFDDEESTDHTEEPIDEFSPYANAIHGDYDISESLYDTLKKYQGLQESSGRAMNQKGYMVITRLLIDGGSTKIDGTEYSVQNGFVKEEEIDAFFDTLCQTEIDGIPGSGIGKPLLEDIVFKGPEIDEVVKLMREIKMDME